MWLYEREIESCMKILYFLYVFKWWVCARKCIQVSTDLMHESAPSHSVTSFFVTHHRREALREEAKGRGEYKTLKRKENERMYRRKFVRKTLRHLKTFSILSVSINLSSIHPQKHVLTKAHTYLALCDGWAAVDTHNEGRTQLTAKAEGVHVAVMHLQREEKIKEIKNRS